MAEKPSLAAVPDRLVADDYLDRVRENFDWVVNTFGKTAISRYTGISDETLTKLQKNRGDGGRLRTFLELGTTVAPLFGFGGAITGAIIGAVLAYLTDQLIVWGYVSVGALVGMVAGAVVAFVLVQNTGRTQTFGFVCRACGNRWGEKEKPVLPKLTRCPKCGAGVRRDVFGGTYCQRCGTGLT
jgi:hypothetical protein